MLSRIISLPFFLITVIFGYWYYQNGVEWQGSMAGIGILFLVIIYIFAPQIDWWWYQKHPPAVDPLVRQLLIKKHPFYNQLSVADKEKFRNRLALYLHSVEFLPKGWEKVPADLQGMIAANAAHVTFYHPNLVLSKFEKIVVYPTPFPSPAYPETIHASELYEEDGVFLFSAQQIMQTFLQPKQYYNLVLHEYVKAFFYQYPDLPLPAVTEENWPELEQISQLTRTQITGMINLPDISPQIVSAVLSLTHPARFQKIDRNLYQKWDAVFKFYYKK